MLLTNEHRFLRLSHLTSVCVDFIRKKQWLFADVFSLKGIILKFPENVCAVLDYLCIWGVKSVLLPLLHTLLRWKTKGCKKYPYTNIEIFHDRIQYWFVWNTIDTLYFILHELFALWLWFCFYLSPAASWQQTLPICLPILPLPSSFYTKRSHNASGYGAIYHVIVSQYIGSPPLYWDMYFRFLPLHTSSETITITQHI